MHGSKVRRARSVVRRKDAIAIDGPRWTAFAAVNVRVSPVAKATCAVGSSSSSSLSCRTS